MGLPTHPNATVRARLWKAWAKAHKRFSAGYEYLSEAHALEGGSTARTAGMIVNYPENPDTHGAHGTVDRATDAMAADSEARDSGDRGNSTGPLN